MKTYSALQNKPTSFSQPSHFAFILVPVVLGVILTLSQDSSRSPLFRIAIFGMLAAAVSAGVFILNVLKQNENG